MLLLAIENYLSKRPVHIFASQSLCYWTFYSNNVITSNVLWLFIFSLFLIFIAKKPQWQFFVSFFFFYKFGQVIDWKHWDTRSHNKALWIKNYSDTSIYVRSDFGFRISVGNATKTERFYFGISHLWVNCKTKPVSKHPGGFLVFAATRVESGKGWSSAKSVEGKLRK